MAQRKTERLMNLFFVLLAAERPLTRSQIRASIADYRESSDAAFERNFERDKEELRQIGAVIEVNDRDEAFRDEPGYRILRDATELPDLALSREEAALLGLAAQTWERTALAGEAAMALAKVKSTGVEIDTDAVRVAYTSFHADAASFDVFLDAATRRIPLSFTYRPRGREASHRKVELWSLVSWRGQWYVTGYDRDREAPRVFRLDRVAGNVQAIGQAGSYEPPKENNSASLISMFAEPTVHAKATVRARAGRAVELRRMASQGASDTDGFDLLTIGYADEDSLARLIAAHGADVVVIAPASLRAAVVAILETVLAEVEQ